MKNIIPKVSIIVPIHNAGEHLTTCLDTLIHQTLTDIEIILVLDYPTDGSDLIAKQYAEKDKRIVILENDLNLHIGNSRNRGIAIAKGEYIGFSDHDDYRELSMYDELYARAIINNSDIVLSFQFDSNTQSNPFFEYNEIFDAKTKELVLSDLIGFGNQENVGALFVNVTNNIYRNDFLKANAIQFVDTTQITPEDVIFQIECIYKAKKICLLKNVFYYHNSHNSNESSNYSYIGYQKRSAGLAHIYSFLKKENIFELYQDSFYTGVTKQFIFSLVGTLYPEKNICMFIKAVKHLRSYPFCKIAFSKYALQPTKKGLINIFFRNLIVNILKL